MRDNQSCDGPLRLGHVVPTLLLRKLFGNPETVLWGVFDHVRTSYRAARQKGAVVGEMSSLVVSICRSSFGAQYKGIYYRCFLVP